MVEAARLDLDALGERIRRARAQRRLSLNDLAGKQQTTGTAAGMIPLEKEWSFQEKNRVGPTIATAFATLTLEHSLYRR